MPLLSHGTAKTITRKYHTNTVETSLNVLNSTCHNGLLLHHIFPQTFQIKNYNITPFQKYL